MAGRKPKPTAVKEMLGNPGKRKLNKTEPTTKPGEPKRPLFLTAIAEQEWDDIVPILLDMKVLTVGDGSALASYCMSFARWQEAEAAISEHGVVFKEPIVGEEGDVVGYRIKKNPACTVAMAEKKEMRAALALFGLDPSSRTRIKGTAGEKPQSELGKLLLMRAQAKKATT